MSGKGVFVTGTDTGVGKSFAAACLVRAWNAAYWKPVQTGLDDDPGGDSATVSRLVDRQDFIPYAPRHSFRAPLSPAAAAAAEGVCIDLADFDRPTTDGRPLVVEGAGGVLVPLTDTHLMTDLIARLALPVLVVARSTLGTINHTLLTLEALRARRLTVAGVILNGPPDAGNRAAIERWGAAPVVAHLPLLAREPDPAALARLATACIPPLDAILP